MDAVILGSAQDLRSGASVIYAQLDVPAYLSLVGDECDAFEIQRSRQDHGIYDRMRDDVKLGALLPGITLADLQPGSSGIRAKLCPPDQAFADFAIRRDPINPHVIQVAGIDSPGLTSSLAIGARVAALLG